MDTQDGDAESVRAWLVEQTYSDDEQNRIILTYSIPVGKRYFPRECALARFGDVRETTAAKDLERVK
ncbi:hypothetical protein [Halarchaeum salinum]|uniref:DUF7967 domain-containing protein n=1 Tax=Halarchaeum salinum TaxID=489912 RepID=A0AAV3S5V0_9EURY